MQQEHFDVVVVGAGLSGIGAGYHLQANCPGRSYVILEGRDCIGGTWDLFRYPGIRSDSDMYTLGYSFKPWTEAKSIADGPAILKYVCETASEFGIDKHIRFGHHALSASWSTQDARWTVEARRGEAAERVSFTCNFLQMCSGYYNYEAGYTPDFPGVDRFEGRIVHPQKWTEDIEYAGKRIVVIGSGATAVTLVPVLAEQASHVTMLQRSPTYVISGPAVDSSAIGLRRLLPTKLAYAITRWRNVLLGLLFFQISRRWPKWTAARIRGGVRAWLGSDYDIETHFTPSYDPWDQRICLVPDGDLFQAIRSGRATVVTDHIETFTERGLLLKSGAELEADLIITATGLNLQLMSDLEFSIDGEPIKMSDKITYKGMMFSGVPNLATSFGYTNASWTLKCDLTCAYVCRLLNHMERKGYAQCTPQLNDSSIEEEPWLDFTSGYVQRGQHMFPKQGSRNPWRAHQNYFLDLAALRYRGLEDGAMEFKR